MSTNPRSPIQPSGDGSCRRPGWPPGTKESSALGKKVPEGEQEPRGLMSGSSSVLFLPTLFSLIKWAQKGWLSQACREPTNMRQCILSAENVGCGVEKAPHRVIITRDAQDR